MGNGEVHSDGVAPPLECRRSMRFALDESTGWGAAVADAMPASSDGLLVSFAFPYEGPEPIVTSDVDVESVPTVTSDMQASLAASRVAVSDTRPAVKELASVPLVSQAIL